VFLATFTVEQYKIDNENVCHMFHPIHNVLVR